MLLGKTKEYRSLLTNLKTITQTNLIITHMENKNTTKTHKVLQRFLVQFFTLQYHGKYI